MTKKPSKRKEKAQDADDAKREIAAARFYEIPPQAVMQSAHIRGVLS